MREQGQRVATDEATEARARFCADVRLVPREHGPELVARLGRAAEDLKRLDWWLREVLLVPVECRT